MFEIIGIMIVIWITWSILKGVLSGAVRGTIARSVEYAASKGVPRHMAKKMITQREVMKQAIKTMGEYDNSFREKDVYEQYGEALVMLYVGYMSERS